MSEGFLTPAETFALRQMVKAPEWKGAISWDGRTKHGKAQRSLVRRGLAVEHKPTPNSYVHYKLTEAGLAEAGRAHPAALQRARGETP